MILDDHWKATLSQMSAPPRGRGVRAHRERLDTGTHLYEVLGFKRAVCATPTDGEARVVTFAAGPLPRALAAGGLPAGPANSGRYEIRPAPYGPVGHRRRLPGVGGGVRVPAHRRLAAQPRKGS